MSNTIYDGKLTTWLEIELDKILTPILPEVGKFYEGKNSYELKTQHPQYQETKQKLISLVREYSLKENEMPPVNAEGEIDHGFCD